MSYKKIVAMFERIATNHPEVKKFGAGFEDQRETKISEDSSRIYCWVTEPKPSGLLEASQIRVEVIVNDLLMNGRENEIDLLSDLDLILEDFKQIIIDEDEFELASFVKINSIGNSEEDEEVTVRAEFTFNIPNIGICQL